MKNILVILFIFLSLQLTGQLMSAVKLHPGVKVIKTMQYNGTAKGKYWNLKYLDQKGRIVLEEKYKKRDLLAVYAYRYDEQNNPVSTSTVYDINYLDKSKPINTTNYNYKYKKGKVIEKVMKGQNSLSIMRISNQIDEFTYEITEVFQHANENEENIDSSKTIITLNNDNKIIKKVEDQFQGIGKNITTYTYYVNGDLRSRSISGNPKPNLTPVYTGAPGSDDMSWEYEYDSKGRIKKLFSIVNGKKYKLETYNYIEW